MKNLTKNWLRYLLQWGVVLAIVAFAFKIFGNETFDPEAYCPFGGLQTFATYLVRGSMACSMTATQIMMGICLAVGVILFSRLFCSYLCPLGTLSEYLGKLRAKLKIKEIVIANGSVLDNIFRAVKYILLFTIFYFTVTNSELFCKNFDPYYAFATGFKGELTVWMACISIFICFLGNFFIKMFWCKYICPLGAISNVFKFTITFVGLLLIFFGLNSLGLTVAWELLLALTCIIGYLYEIIFKASKIFPILKVTRRDDLCNNCGVCAKKCPYSIDVNKLKTVKSVDCTLCGECISSCNKSALQINKCNSLRWAPAILSVVLFALAIYLGTTVELPTIDEKWGTEEQQNEHLEKLTVDGLRSVKCFGSSKAFSAQVQKILGVYGVATYVKHARVVILYNPAETDPAKIREAIYTPTKFKVNHPSTQDSLIKVVTIRTENMHDKMDPNYLGMQFRNSGRKYIGLDTQYACPIIVRVYCALDEAIVEKLYKERVVMKTRQIPVHGGGVKTIDVDYKFVSIEKQIDTITRREFLESQFKTFEKQYKTNIEKYGLDNTETFELPYPNLDKPLVTRSIPYLSSHLSQTDGMLEMRTILNGNDEYAFVFTFDKSVMNKEKLMEVLRAPKWTIKMKDGSIDIVDAKISF